MIILYDNGDGRGTRIDREALSELTGRSPETIRRRCLAVDYRDGRALYKLRDALTILAAIPERKRNGSGTGRHTGTRATALLLDQRAGFG